MESKTNRKRIGILSLFLAFVLSVSALAPTAAAAQTSSATTPASSNASNSKTKVAYGTAKYPNLSNVTYTTYRTLDYQTKTGYNTYFYDFRDTWYAGCDYLPDGKYPDKVFLDLQGFWGVRASTEKDVLTYEVYTDFDNVTVSGVEFRTYDDADAIILKDTANETYTVTTTQPEERPLRPVRLV